MRKTILCALVVWLVSSVQGQVILNHLLPPAGLTIKSQLWNLSLINTSSGSVDVRIEMTFSRVSNNQLVLSGVTKRFALPRGLRQVQAIELMPIAYTAASGSNIDPGPDGFLPIGIFNICYTVIVINNDAYERQPDECETIEIEPVSPPQLISPHDGEFVEIPRPLFLWLPPSPHNLFNTLRYDWLLVEVQSLQSAGDAIQQNIPLLIQQNIAYSNLQYPLSGPRLDSSKIYAWRIVAKDNNAAVATSEIWTFRLKQLGYDSTIVHGSKTYYKLRKEENAAFAICNGVLRFEYLNEQNEQTINFKITDLGTSRRKNILVDTDTIPIHFGQNFIELDLTETRGLNRKNLYLFQVSNQKNESWYLKFEYRQPE